MILTLNKGSSSLKFQLYNWRERLSVATGVVERVGDRCSTLTLKRHQQETISAQQPCADHGQAFEWGLKVVRENGLLNSLDDIDAVGHRIFHGGETFRHSVLLDDATLAEFDRIAALCTIHLPPTLKTVREIRNLLPNVPHVAVTDTAWHTSIPAENYLYGLPLDWHRRYGVRRYGFHGISYLYTAKRAAVLLGQDPLQLNLIIVHLGSGSSVCAVKNGLSYQTSMGMNPLSGLLMGTRSGDIDPAIVPYMINKLQISPVEIDRILNEDSGLVGLTGQSDRRDIIGQAERNHQPSQLALALECNRIKEYIGGYAALLGRVDAVVFTAGVGELSAFHRQQSLGNLALMGIKLDQERNQLSVSRNCETQISAAGSKVKIFVIPTDEEQVISEDAWAVKNGTCRPHTEFRYSFQEPDYLNKTRAALLPQDLARCPGLAGITVP